MGDNVADETVELLKIDLGCGSNKRVGFKGVDSIAFEGVDIVADLTKPWPFENDSVDEAHTSHFVEHLDAEERVFFVNELYRVLKVGAKCQIIVPSWSSCRAYGDLTHKWPPVSTFWFYYLNRDWRIGNEEKKQSASAPHADIKFNPKGYNCDFDSSWGFSVHPTIQPRNQEYQMHALTFYIEAAQDIAATITKRPTT